MTIRGLSSVLQRRLDEADGNPYRLDIAGLGFFRGPVVALMDDAVLPLPPIGNDGRPCKIANTTRPWDAAAATTKTFPEDAPEEERFLSISIVGYLRAADRLEWWEVVGFKAGYHTPHKHLHVSSEFCFTKGRGWLQLGEEWMKIVPGLVVDVPAGVPHGFLSDEEVTFVSVQLNGMMISPQDGKPVDFVMLKEGEYTRLAPEEQARMLAEVAADRAAEAQLRRAWREPEEHTGILR